MMKSSRFIIIFVLVAVLVLTCTVRLFDLQIIKGAQYREAAQQRLIRAYPVKAPRGEIYDRNGELLVANRTGYVVQIQDIGLSDEELNGIILKLVNLLSGNEDELNSEFPIVYNKDTNQPEYDFGVTAADVKQEESKDDKNENGGAPTSAPDAAQLVEEKQNELMTAWEAENKLTNYGTLTEIIDSFKQKYHVSGEYDLKDALAIISVRYDMDKSSFSESTPYVMASDVSENVVQQVKERYMEFPGTNIELEPVRDYPGGTLAAHILGRTGPIFAEEYAELKEKGYGMNDTIGKDGLEKVLESYLKGTDGYKSVELSRGGNVNQILQSKPAEPGNYAMLTLDKGLQETLEQALAQNVGQSGSGSGGAAIAVDPKTGEILATASYPSYNLNKFNEDYDNLLKDSKNPLFNRVFAGTYSPGSTFKMATAVAGMESGTITPSTRITDRGRYTFYKDYQPTCLIYSSGGGTHGTINVSEAIGVSCNYFFYEVGRLTTIEKIDEYAHKLGLGEKTGVELDESTGVVASPEYREKMGGTWYPGDVLQASIGQSDHLFTPAQLASYVSTILNKGTRYSLHMVREICEYGTPNIVFKKEPVIVSNNPIADSTYEAVKDGMRRVVASGTARAAFSDAKYTAAGKTGTAEVPGGADNVLFVGFAPYDDPQIVVAVVIEHGASSSYPAKVAREAFDKYLGYDKDAQENKKDGETHENTENYTEED